MVENTYFHPATEDQMDGLTLRAWLAGLAMQALISNEAWVKNTESWSEVAVHAVRAADALLAELAK